MSRSSRYPGNDTAQVETRCYNGAGSAVRAQSEARQEKIRTCILRDSDLVGSAVRTRIERSGDVMPNYRRAYVPGGMFFFTLVTEGRVPILTDPEARRHLRQTFLTAMSVAVFRIEAIVSPS